MDMQKKIIVAPINAESESKPLFATIREFPTERMILLTSQDGILKSEEFAKDLEKFGIASSIVNVETKNPWISYFQTLAEVLQGQNKDNVIINISTADRISQCALTNAAHVNGIKAIAVINEKIWVLPILKFSYASMLSDKKMRILEELHRNVCFGSLEEVSKKTGMSLQLVSYHIHGSEKSKGLKNLELVEITD